MNPKDILDNLDNENIEDIELSEENILEIERERLKKKLKKKLKKGKSIRKSVMTASIAVALIGVISTPTVAANIPILNDLYKQLGFFSGYEEYTNYIGESKESNGFRVTIENIIAVPDKLQAVVKIESEKPLTNNPKEDNFKINVDMDTFKSGSSTASGGYAYYIDDNTIILNFEESLNGDNYPKQGNLTLNIQKLSPDFKTKELDLSFEAKIDFSSAFNNKYEVDVNKAVNDKIKLDKLVANAMGSKLHFSGKDSSYINDVWGPKYFVEVDGKIYAQTVGGNVNFPQLTANVLRDANSINCIISDTKTPIKWDANGVTVTIENVQENNIKFPKTITSQDGLKGEFYKVEWESDTLKFYFRSEYEAMPILDGLSLSVSNNENDKNFNRYSNKYSIEKTDEGYIAEFKDVNKEKNIELIYHNQGLPLYNFKKPQVIKIK